MLRTVAALVRSMFIGPESRSAGLFVMKPKAESPRRAFAGFWEERERTRVDVILAESVSTSAT